MDKEKIIQLLTEEGYPSFMWERTIEKLENLDPAVRVAFRELMEGHSPFISIEGYSFDSLVHEYRMKPIGALLTLDWLVRCPQEALMSLKQPIKL